MPFRTEMSKLIKEPFYQFAIKGYFSLSSWLSKNTAHVKQDKADIFIGTFVLVSETPGFETPGFETVKWEKRKKNKQFKKKLNQLKK